MSSPINQPLVGRTQELEELAERARDGLVVIFGPSGVGKTKLVEEFCRKVSALDEYDTVLVRTLYRTDWTNALSQLKKHLGDVPANATLEELENAIIDLGTRDRLMLVLDNVEEANVADVELFIAKWRTVPSSSCLMITAQPDVRSVLPASWPDLELRGLTAEEDVLSILGDLKSNLPIAELKHVGEVLEGNPQLLLFLRWLEPTSVIALQESAAKLADRKTAEAVEDLVDQTSLSTLFFLALGVHKDLNVTDELLAALWDHFGSRGAEPFLRSLKLLVDRGFLTPTRQGSYRLHESVHVSLPKALRHRVGDDRVPSLHHYFAEYYRRLLYRASASSSLAHFVYHARLAEDYRLLYDTLIGGGIAQSLASHGSALQVRSELQTLQQELTTDVLRPEELANLYLVLGRLCNDLSDHSTALAFMNQCEAILDRIDDPAVAATMQREVWYISAVGFSNTGQSDECLQNYFRIVDSCGEDVDELACVSLGYLAHDLKYRNLDVAAELGRLSIDWARSFDSGIILAKNLCSFAETSVLLGQFDVARRLFREAEVLALAHNNRRELGRILTNWGFAEMLAGGTRDIEMIRAGTEHSKALGDRRRYFQGLLYNGVCLTSQGERVAGRSLILQGARGFHSLSDGRYFTPAVLWLLQLDGCRVDRVMANIEDDEARADVADLLGYYFGHPEFGTYRRFWFDHLSRCLGGKLER